jgi:hypothetical protein
MPNQPLGVEVGHIALERLKLLKKQSMGYKALQVEVGHIALERLKPSRSSASMLWRSWK